MNPCTRGRVAPHSRAALGLLAACVALASCSGGMTDRRDDVVVRATSIADVYTARTTPAGELTTRDLAPSPRPREAITSDDYFAIKLEDIYAHGLFERAREGRAPEYGNIALVAEVGGIVPPDLDCSLVPEAELEFSLGSSESSNARTPGNCAFKTVVAINPVFNDAHANLSSAFITPPFRSNNQPLEFRFIMAELRDTELAQKIVDWVSDMTGIGPEENARTWQQRLINAGFSAVHWLLDRASKPTYLLEFSTDFVPVETVEGAVPQNLLMNADFVLVGVPRDTETTPSSVIQASEQLIFRDGRLLWREGGDEYRESPYVVFKVVRFSRYPGPLPLDLTELARELRRSDIRRDQRERGLDLVDDLQREGTLNETEGAFLRRAVTWLADTAELIESAEEGVDRVPLALSALPVAYAAELAPIEVLEELHDAVEQLQGSIYEDFGQTPGIRQGECVAFRDLNQRAARAFEEVRPDVVTAFESLQIRRSQLARARDSRTPEQSAEFDAIMSVEALLDGRLRDLPETLAEPSCPGMREAWEE